MNIKSNSNYDLLWTDKYKPKSLDDVFGNKQAIKKISQWISDFKNKVEGTKSGLFISGPPGIGKTTIAHLILNLFNYEVIEYNASDVRSQKSVKESLTKAINSLNISIMQHNNIKYIGIIMDEVDGMSSGDRGGVAELVSLINPNKGKRKGNKKKIDYINPIICISNNNTDKKLCDLRKNCLEVIFNKPTCFEISNFIKLIIKNEKIDIDDQGVNLLTNYAQNDFRRACHILQDTNNTYSGRITLSEIENIGKTFLKKNIEISIFDATNKLLSEYNNIEGSLNLYESDRSLVSMMVHENINNQIYFKNKNDLHKLNDIYKISHNMSIGDIIDKHIYNNQTWNLQDYNGIIKCVYPSYKLSKINTEKKAILAPIIFTSILSKSAIQFSNFKCITSLKNKFNIDKNNICYLIDIILENILISKDKEKINKTISLIKEYDLAVSDLEKMIKITKINSSLEYKKILTNKIKNNLVNNFDIPLDYLE